MTRILTLIAVLLIGTNLAFQADADASEKRAAGKEVKSVAGPVWTDGEVLRVDKGRGSVTIKHGPMPKFDMPAMAMPYQVKDKSALDQLKPGDRIRFDADSVGGVFTVVRLEKLK
jgi:Cu/Ag efflux protein CusF